MILYGILGAGGFAREVMPLVQQQVAKEHGSGTYKCAFVLEDDYPITEKYINGVEVISLTEFLSTNCDQRYFNIAISKSEARERISKMIPASLAKPFSITAATHIALANNQVGEGGFFAHFTHITSNIKIGKFFHSNIGCIIGHDCIIGDYVTLGPDVKCNGWVRIEDHAYIGAGAIIKDGTDKPIVIGKGAVVGMGAVVTKSVPPGVTVVGNPAKPLTNQPARRHLEVVEVASA